MNRSVARPPIAHFRQWKEELTVCAQCIAPARGGLSARQRRVRLRACQLCFKAAVRLAADALFGFTHRAPDGDALWSNTVSVWLGSATFIHWAMGEVDIDIPRIVADTDGAPENANELHATVHAELAAYWADCLASLPPKSTPGWRPLP
jgi:hypothetical protein